MEGVPAPGPLHLHAATPNPDGAMGCRLFLFEGDATTVPLQHVACEPQVAIPASQFNLDSPEFHLRIFHFNDLHGHLAHFTRGGEQPVLPRLAWQIQSARQACRNEPDTAVLVISAGDDCGGSIFDEMLLAESHNTPVHPGYRLYSKMGVDVAGLGNHDLDRGLPRLASCIRKDARFPLLAANLRGCRELVGVCYPAALLVVKGVRVALIGLVTRAETHLDPGTCQIVDPVPVVRNLLPVIRPLCDVLILITHLGYSLGNSTVPMADAGDVELARSLSPGSVDLIVGGHSHTALNLHGLAAENIVQGIPIVQAGSQGSYLGQVDLTLRTNAVTLTGAKLIPTDSLPAQEHFADQEMRPLIQQAKDLLGQRLGEVEADPELSTTWVQGSFAARELALANFITDALVERLAERGQPVDFAMIDSSGLLCGLPVGGYLTLGDWFEVMPYADTLRLFQVSSHQVKEFLDDNAIRADRPGEPHTERGFVQFSRQLRYHVCLAGSRPQAYAGKIQVDGLPPDQHSSRTFTIATTSFARELACGWEKRWKQEQDRCLLDLHEFPFIETDLFLRQELVAYIREHGGVTRMAGARRDGRLILFA